MILKFEIRESIRAKHLRITVYPDARVMVTKPMRVSAAQVEKFVRKYEEWINERVAKFQKRLTRIREVMPEGYAGLPKPRKGSKAYKDARKRAREIALERLAYFSELYGISHGRVSIRDQKTRWGSCSAKGDLSFNYKIAFLPPAHADYVIVHELCHVREHNHSNKFWTLVAKTVPDHKKLRRDLRTIYSY
ncbi:MAG: putative metal-dependent hydrolase [Parcubacteria group bacterium]|nr:putative metal-dependent hydrolase [Parcubacteria group bacterium]